jgi:hypothetical protein
MHELEARQAARKQRAEDAKNVIGYPLAQEVKGDAAPDSKATKKSTKKDANNALGNDPVSETGDQTPATRAIDKSANPNPFAAGEDGKEADKS